MGVRSTSAGQEDLTHTKEGNGGEGKGSDRHKGKNRHGKEVDTSQKKKMIHKRTKLCRDADNRRKHEVG